MGELGKWETPKVIEINVSAVKQQEEELLYQLLVNEKGFKLLTGSLPS
jgi:hypothetical protein